jgi:hypothetical protein
MGLRIHHGFGCMDSGPDDGCNRCRGFLLHDFSIREPLTNVKRFFRLTT